jgi:FKBP-type peptidyl-prolyl cis-trans isomerase
MIPGFIEGLEKLSFGDKAIYSYSPHLAYAQVREM